MKPKMELARVNDYQEAKRFFDEYDIPYEEITEGEDKGKLLVRLIRPEDRNWEYEATRHLERSKLLIAITDHPNVFRDRNDQSIVTFSPYNISELPKNRPWLEMSEHSIYGHGTKTFVVRSNLLEEEKQQKAAKKELDEQIRRVEEQVRIAKWDLEAAQEKLDCLLKKQAEMKKGRQRRKVSLKLWDFTWEGNATWDGGNVCMNCSFYVKAGFQADHEGIRGEEIRKLEREHPGYALQDVITALQKSLKESLDLDFEDYCTEDEYYPPVVEDFDAKSIIQQWAEERGLQMTSYTEKGSDDGYEPKRGRW